MEEDEMIGKKNLLGIVCTEAVEQEIERKTKADEEKLKDFWGVQCEHGSLRRQCLTCEQQEEITRLRARVEEMEKSSHKGDVRMEEHKANSAKMMSEQGRGTVNVQELIIENRELRARIEELERERDEARQLAIDLADEDKCMYDRQGYCQTHALHEKPCPIEVIQSKDWAEIPEPEGE
jgi:hypothetical protein